MMIGRFGVGWACGAIAMTAYYEYRAAVGFWPILVGAFVPSVVAGKLAEKYLPG